MAKLILVSMILATVVLPLRAAADANAQRGLRRAVWSMIVFNCLYVLGLMIFTPPLK